MKQTLKSRLNKIEEHIERSKPHPPIIWNRSILSEEENQIVDELVGIRNTKKCGAREGLVESLPIPSFISDVEYVLSDTIDSLLEKHPNNKGPFGSPLIIYMTSRIIDGKPWVSQHENEEATV